MLKLITLTILALAASAYATEFKAHISDIDCTITSKGAVTRTQSFGKDSKISFTETKTVTLSNIDALLPKVMEVSSQTVPGTDEEYVYSMNHEGSSYTLSAADSKESMFLVRLITNTCR